MASKGFYDHVRGSLFGGRLKQHHVEGMNRIVAYALAHGYSREEAAYALATAYHETARWMQPIREGARRYGPAYRHESAIRAVTAIYSKGIIRTNYALPAGPWGLSYYGRGLVQITWYENYLRLGKAIALGDDLARNPDRALDWDVALDLLFIGLRDGLYTGKGFNDYTFPEDFAGARAMVNGDVRKNGSRIAGYAREFVTALEDDYGTQPVCTG